MEIELGSRAIPFSSKPRHPIWYKNHLLKKYYDSDLLVNAGIVVELKAVKALTPEHDAQMLNELRMPFLEPPVNVIVRAPPFCGLLSGAGNETVTKLLGNAVVLLARHPGLLLAMLGWAATAALIIYR